MAIFYLDFINGNDGNNGSSWANAWKTVSSGATAARIAPGDEIRIAETPETSLGFNATFTNGSATISTANTIVKNIADAVTTSGWVTSANITVGTSSSRRFGATALTITPATAFTTGKMVYSLISGGGTQDFSSYTKISLNVRCTSSSIPANYIRIALCSDTTGDVIVDQFTINVALSSTWRTFVYDKGSALSSTVQSVAVYCDTDPGTTPLSINNVVACTSITHDTIVGPQNECIYAVRSLSPTSIEIDSGSTSTSGRGYFSATNTSTLYKIDPILYDTNTSVDDTQEVGTTHLMISYIGGYNTTSNTVTGRTCFSNKLLSVGTIFRLSRFNNASNLLISRFSAQKLSVVASAPHGVGIINNCVFTVGPLLLAGGILHKSCIMHNISSMISGSSTVFGLNFESCILASFTTDAFSQSTPIKMSGCSILNGAASAIYNVLGLPDNYTLTASIVPLYKCTLEPTVEVSYGTTSCGIIWSMDTDNVAGNHKGYTHGASINWQTSVKTGSDPGAWKMSIATNNIRTVNYPVLVPLADIPCTSGETIQVTANVKKDDASNIIAGLIVQGHPMSLEGVTDQTVLFDSTTSWHTKQITFTPTQSGIVRVGAIFYQSSAGSLTGTNAYVGSITVQSV